MNSCMYLLWVSGNLANGRIGELNLRTYIFICSGALADFLLRVVFGLGVAASTVLSAAVADFGGLPLRFFGGSVVDGSSLADENCLCGYPKS